MIEVSCHLDSGSVSLAGQLIQCSVSLHCTSAEPSPLLTGSSSQPPASAASGDSSNSSSEQRIAWVSAQVQCYCQINSRLVHWSAAPDSRPRPVVHAASRTSYRPEGGERDRVVSSSRPLILACDLALSPAETRRFSYSHQLQPDAPPSYRGLAVCYTYKVSVAVQRVGGAVHVLRVPVHVLALPRALLPLLARPLSRGGGGSCDGGGGGHSSGESHDTAPTNPFLIAEEGCDEAGDSGTHRRPLQLLQQLALTRSPNTFNISNKHGRVLRFHIFKLAYRLGDEIVALLDFGGATVACVQYAVRLESVETVADQHRPASATASATGAKWRPHVQQYSTWHEVCLNVRVASLSLPVPVNVTPGFSTPLVTLSWRLHFEFVTTCQSTSGLSAADSADSAISWQAPATLAIETMVWDLPITLHPTCPSHVLHTVGASARQASKITV